MEPLVKHKYIKDKLTDVVSIFIVDDDISYLYPLVFYLQKNTHYKIYCFTSGEECIENIKLKPNLILLDYNLNPQPPHTMNGPDVLRRVKNICPKTKVVMLSSRDTQQAVVDTMKLGAYSYILKDTEAIAAIRNILKIISNGNGKHPNTDVT
jgi:DNA-binding NarL/FixJ family response regulator